jgi:cytoskeletal protein RodZ
MGKGSLTLILIAIMLTATALAQEIVIEPTNGRAPTTNHGSRPDLSLQAPAQPIQGEAKKPVTKSSAKSADQERGSARTKKVPATQIAVKPKTAPVETKPTLLATPETSETAEAAPAPKKATERRPAWAMADTRDAAGLQSEIAGALARDPKLAGSAIRVSVDDGSVTLDGRAAGGQERLQAQRLAKSYAWNRKLVDHIVVDRTPPERAAVPSMAAQQ